jgi:lysozyme
MHISQAGLDLIKSFEGYLDRLPDGSCRAYLCPAGVWTIGWGCTEGVTEGMAWTKDQAEQGLRKELIQHENHVKRLVTTDLNQHEFDALVSFTYNVGTGRPKGEGKKEIPGLSTSTLLRCLNSGDRAGAARAFHQWNKGGGKVLPGLVSRRAREATLFLSPTEAPTKPEMPQKVEASPGPVSDASQRSMTVFGGLIALFGSCVQYLEQVVAVGMDSLAEVTKLAPLKALGPNTKTIGMALTVAAVALVIGRRLQAAKNGKVG